MANKNSQLRSWITRKRNRKRHRQRAKKAWETIFKSEKKLLEFFKRRYKKVDVLSAPRYYPDFSFKVNNGKVLYVEMKRNVKSDRLNHHQYKQFKKLISDGKKVFITRYKRDKKDKLHISDPEGPLNLKSIVKFKPK